MKYVTLTAVLLALLLASPVASSEKNDQNWIPFATIASEGSIDLSVLRPSQRSLYERSVEQLRPRAEQKSGGQIGRTCDTEIIHEFDPVVPPLPTFRGQLENAALVLTGEIVSAEQGFFYSNPGMALGIRVGSVLKAPAESSVPEVVHVFYPWAEFEVSGVTICARGYHGDQEPEVGQEALLALMNAMPLDAGPAPAGFISEEEIIFSLRKGGVAVPHAYLADVDLVPEDSFDDLARWIRESLLPTWQDE